MLFQIIFNEIDLCSSASGQRGIIRFLSEKKFYREMHFEN